MGVGEPDSKRNVVFVLGMHRSGTSAVSRLLSLLGCDLPKTLMPESPDNARGYWESLPITHLNDAILASGGSHWDDWLPFNAHWYNSPVYSSFVERGRDVLRDEFGASPLFVLKDPRCARLVPYWKDVFERESIRPLVLIPVRNPLEVSGSITSRDHIHQDIVHLLWLRHVLDAEHDTRGLTRAFTTYDKLLSNWSDVAARLQERFGISWPGLSLMTGTKVSDFLDPSFRHHDASSDNMLSNPLVAGWLRDTYAIMLRWASDGELRADYDELDRIRLGFNASGPAFAGIAQALLDEGVRSRELQLSLGSKVTEVSALSTDLASLHAALEATRMELTAKQAEGSAEADVGAREAEIAALETAAQALRNRLAEVEGALLQREEELRRAASEGASRVERAEALEAEKRAIEAKLQAADEAARSQHAALRASDEAADHAKAEARDLRDRLAYIESTLRQREEEVAQAGTENELVRARVEALEAEKLRIKAKLEDADQWVFRLAEQRQQAHARIARLEIEINNKERELKTAHRKIERGQSKHRELEALLSAGRTDPTSEAQDVPADDIVGDATEIPSTEIESDLQQRDRMAEIAKLSEMLREQSEKAAMLDVRMRERVGEIATLTQLLREQNGKVAALIDSHAAIEALADDRMRQVQRAEAQVDQISEANRQKDLELAAIAASGGGAQTRIENYATEVVTLSRMLREQQGQIDLLDRGYATMERLAAERLVEIERLKATVGASNGAAERPDSESLGALSANAAMQARFEKASGEISTLTKMLVQEGQKADKSAEQAEWLRKVMPVILRTRWWHKLVTKEMVTRRKLRMLQRKGLFDADAYVARYPDVITAGIDPLQHYIIHGMDEERVR